MTHRRPVTRWIEPQHRRLPLIAFFLASLVAFAVIIELLGWIIGNVILSLQ